MMTFIEGESVIATVECPARNRYIKKGSEYTIKQYQDDEVRPRVILEEYPDMIFAARDFARRL